MGLAGPPFNRGKSCGAVPGARAFTAPKYRSLRGLNWSVPPRAGVLCGRGPLCLAAAADLCYDFGALQDDPGTEMMKTFDWQRLLRQHSLFSSLSEEEIARLLDDEVSQERDCPQDQVILREGIWADSIFLIGSGAVSVVLLKKDGEKVTLSTLRGGEFFGEMALLEKRPRSATVIANERCSLLEIKGDEFLKLMHDHSDIEFKVMLNLSERLRQASEQILAVRLSDVDEKIDAFDTKLDARLKAADAQMEAAQTVFEQTNTRANEIIESAERSRTRLTTAVSTIGGIIAIVVGLGGSISYFSLQDTFNQVEINAKEVEEILVDIKEQAMQASSDAAKVAMAKINVDTVSQVEELINKTRIGIVRSLLLPGFRDALKEGNVHYAKVYYEDIMDVITSANLTEQLIIQLPSIDLLLNEIELQMVAQVGKIEEQTVAQNDQNGQGSIDYAVVLGSIFNDAASPEEKIQSAFLLLTSMIIKEQEEAKVGENWTKYDEILSELEKNFRKATNHKITGNAKLITLIGKNKIQKFCALVKLVPLNDQKIQKLFCPN